MRCAIISGPLVNGATARRALTAMTAATTIVNDHATAAVGPRSGLANDPGRAWSLVSVADVAETEWRW
jgi:hypothetical protein